MTNSRTSSYFDEIPYEITEIVSDIKPVVLPQKTYRVVAGQLYVIDPGSPEIRICPDCREGKK
jgi:hypothetical protein